MERAHQKWRDTTIIDTPWILTIQTVGAIVAVGRYRIRECLAQILRDETSRHDVIDVGNVAEVLDMDVHELRQAFGGVSNILLPFDLFAFSSGK